MLCVLLQYNLIGPILIFFSYCSKLFL